MKAWKGYGIASRGKHWAPPKTSEYAEYIERNFIPGYLEIKRVPALLDTLDEAGLIHHPKKGFWPGLKRYQDANSGSYSQALITDIPGFTNYNKQGMLGFPTEKPVRLLERLIRVGAGGMC